MSTATEGALGLARALNAFGVDLHGRFPRDENLFFSPLSIGAALTAIHAGARGETAAEMARTLHLQDSMDPGAAMRSLRAALAPRTDGQMVRSDDGEGWVSTGPEVFELTMATALWVLEKYLLRTEFCDALVDDFGARFYSDPFTDKEAVAARVNGWAGEHTEGRITRVLDHTMIEDDLRLILANAVYFRGVWVHDFNESSTGPAPFNLASGDSVSVETMHQELDVGYWLDQDLGAQAITLPYEGDLSMAIVLPDPGTLSAVEGALAGGLLQRVRGGRAVTPIDLAMPKWEMRFTARLGETLLDLGMEAAFDASRADLSGITPEPGGLALSDAVHQAWVRVDEKGTEAAAVTVLMALGAGMPEEDVPVPFVVDRPFLFFIVDERTDAVLFQGRVMDPRG